MATDVAVRQIVDRYHVASTTVQYRVQAFLRQQWMTLGGYTRSDIGEFAGRVAPMVGAAQQAMANLTDRYIADLGSASGPPMRPVGIPAEIVTDDTMRGVPAEVVYETPYATLVEERANGKSLAVAAGLALLRAQIAAATDLQLARTHSSRYAMAGQVRVIGYRRTISGFKTCRLCVTAAARGIYRKEGLMPIHARCGCGVAPVFKEADPLADLNDELFAERDFTEATEEALIEANQVAITRYEAAFKRSVAISERGSAREIAAAAAKRDEAAEMIRRRKAQLDDLRGNREPTTVAVRQHGQLGPILVDADHHFSAP